MRLCLTMGFLALWSVLTRSIFFGHNSNTESVQWIVDPLTQRREPRCQEVEHLSTFQRGSLVTQTIKSLPAGWETQVQPLGWEDSLEKGMATHSSILAWRIPRSLEGYSPGVAKSHTRLTSNAFFHVSEREAEPL